MDRVLRFGRYLVNFEPHKASWMLFEASLNTFELFLNVRGSHFRTFRTVKKLLALKMFAAWKFSRKFYLVLHARSSTASAATDFHGFAFTLLRRERDKRSHDAIVGCRRVPVRPSFFCAYARLRGTCSRAVQPTESLMLVA